MATAVPERDNLAARYTLWLAQWQAGLQSVDQGAAYYVVNDLKPAPSVQAPGLATTSTALRACSPGPACRLPERSLAGRRLLVGLAGTSRRDLLCADDHATGRYRARLQEIAVGPSILGDGEGLSAATVNESAAQR